MLHFLTINYGGVSVGAILLRLGLAVLIGGALGLERKFRDRALGLRSYILVCAGSTMISLLSRFVIETYQTGDPNRLNAQVISAIALLGAGSVIITREKRIEGLTTVIGLWTAGTIGIALGEGYYVGALLTGLLVFITFTLLERFESAILKRRTYVYFYFELASPRDVLPFFDHVDSLGYEIQTKTLHRSDLSDTPTVGLNLRLRRPPDENLNDMVNRLAKFPELLYLVVDSKLF